jgi:hypothetical protein
LLNNQFAIRKATEQNMRVITTSTHVNSTETPTIGDISASHPNNVVPMVDTAEAIVDTIEAAGVNSPENTLNSVSSNEINQSESITYHSRTCRR